MLNERGQRNSGRSNSHPVKGSGTGMWKRSPIAGPGGTGRLYRKLSRRERPVPEGAQLTHLLGAPRGGDAGKTDSGGASTGRMRAWSLAY